MATEKSDLLPRSKSDFFLEQQQSNKSFDKESDLLIQSKSDLLFWIQTNTTFNSTSVNECNANRIHRSINQSNKNKLNRHWIYFEKVNPIGVSAKIEYIKNRKLQKNRIYFQEVNPTTSLQKEPWWYREQNTSVCIKSERKQRVHTWKISLHLVRNEAIHQRDPKKTKEKQRG